MKRWPALLAALATVALLASVALAAAPGTNVLISRPSGVAPTATPTTNHSSLGVGEIGALGGASPRVVADADNQRYVAFVSQADGLSDEDDNRVSNVYLRDRTLDTTILVSRANGPAGAGANGGSREPSISADGRFVAFESTATNLAPGVTGAATHIYVRDVFDGETRLMDRADGPDGAIANGGSSSPSLTVISNSPVVAFTSGATNLDGATGGFNQVYIRDASDNDTEMVSRSDDSLAQPNDDGNGSSANPSISTDGTNIAFQSDATNLTANIDSNSRTDIYVRTRAPDNETRAASISGGLFGNGNSTRPSISGDGNEVAFTSTSDNLVSVVDNDLEADVYVRRFSPSNIVVASATPGGQDPNAPAGEASLSDTGSTVVFSSPASDLTAGDTNGSTDVFLRTGAFTANPATSRLSAPSNGVQSDDGSSAPSISRGFSGLNNYRVAFQTTADNMGADDENDFQQIYTNVTGTVVGDRVPEYISRPSGNGAFRSGVNVSSLRPEGRGAETTVSMSQDGRYTVFLSASDELSDVDDNRFINVFRRDNQTGETILVSRADGAAGAAANGTSAANPSAGLGSSPGDPLGAPAISADGNRIVFCTSASNLVAGDANAAPDVFVRDIATGTTVLAGRQPDGSGIPFGSGDPGISGDGNRVAFITRTSMDPMDGNNDADVYLRDLAAGTTQLMSRRGPGGPAGNNSSSDPALDADGSHVAFETSSTDLLPTVTDLNMGGDIMLRDVAAGQTTVVSRALGGSSTGNDFSVAPAISADGNKVAFTSGATDVGTGQDLNGAAPDVFVRDMSAGTAALVSLTSGANGVSGNSAAERASISADGTRITFESNSTDLVPGDNNAALDIFVRDLTANTTELVSTGAAGPSAWHSQTPSLSGDGNCIAFETFADNLVTMPPGTDHRRVLGRALRGDCPFEPAPEPSGDNAAPIISKVSIKPKRFLAGKKLRKKTKKRPAVGGRLRYTLSEDASVSVRIDAKLKGRRVGKRCVKPRPKNRKRRRCSRFVKRQTLRQDGKAGANRLSITGRVKRRNLKPGPYRITITATDEAGNVSAPKRVNFKILRKKQRKR